MKLSRTMVVLASVGLVGAGGVWLGCGGDDTTTVPGADAGKDVTSNPDTGTNDTGTNDTGTNDTGTNDSGGGDAGDAGSDSGFKLDGAVPLNCAAYCNVIGNVCTGNNLQYNDNATCLAMCAKFTVGDAGAQAGNTLACRASHVALAAGGTAAADTHCKHAGAYGFATCGTEAEDFCALYAAQCGSYGNGQCPNSFGGLNNVNGDPNLATTTGNNKDCREYHLEAAYKANDTAGNGHCVHASSASSAGFCQ
jgi:hypothetical protein